MPAALISASTRPKRLRTEDAMVYTAVGSQTSQVNASGVTRAAIASATDSASAAGLRPINATCQLLRARCKAAERPIPEPVPVTTAQSLISEFIAQSCVELIESYGHPRIYETN